MSAHFWLSRKAVPMTLADVAQLTDLQARDLLARMRWGDDGQVCPSCGAVDHHYVVRGRYQWRCKACNHTFSVTSGTPFADHKIGYRKLVMAIFAFLINQKGLAALQLRRIIGGQYRTAFTLLHKIREAVMLNASRAQLSGTVEIDGGHFSGKIRKGRKKVKVADKDKTQIPKKYSQHRSKLPADYLHHPNRRIVMVLREIDPAPGLGAVRTITAICKMENTTNAEALVQQWVKKQSLIRTDEWTAYGNLKLMGYTHETVNHSVEFSSDSGINQNQAESFFSRMRRSVIGVYHRITPKYMIDYACEMGWREDHRRLSTAEQFASLVKQVFAAGVSPDWWQYGKGNMRRAEILFNPA